MPNLQPLGSDHPRIHETGLAADFLNRFNEAVMLLDLIPGEPEYLDDLALTRECRRFPRLDSLLLRGAF
jgi:hypothetical protein